MELNFREKKVVKIMLPDAEYSVREGSTREQIEFAKKSEKANDDPSKQLDLTVEYLDRLGLPKKVSYDLPSSYLVQILQAVNELGGAGKK